MDNETVIERLQTEFGDKIGPVSSMLSGEATITVPREQIVAVAQFLRDDQRHYNRC